MTEAAVTAGQKPGRCQNFYLRTSYKHGKPTAKIALVRELLTIAFSVLKRRTPYEERG